MLSKWIDIGKKKPDHKEWKQYLVYVNTGMCIPSAGINNAWAYKLAMYCNKDGFCLEGKPTDKVTHWMKLPKSPPLVSVKRNLFTLTEYFGSQRSKRKGRE